MILGIGIDAIEVVRFADWHMMPHEQLARIFSPKEIVYCLQSQDKGAQRFAARFAAREAFFKAFNQFQPDAQIPFLTWCKKLAIIKDEQGVPSLQVDWPPKLINTPDVLLSFTHLKEMAIAWVILQKK
jgi:holo-[acyl-carrier protein] synthase